MTCRIEGGVTYSQAYNEENRISSIAKRTGDCATGTIVESWSFAGACPERSEGTGMECACSLPTSPARAERPTRPHPISWADNTK
ncbi:MAG: hypothetical protein AB1607_14435 [Chloroflexota bacterium]